MNAKMSTNANTIGAEPFIAERESMSIAVPPVTPYSTSSSVPSVAGTISLRRLVTPDSESASLPLPASGTVIVSAVPRGLTSVSIDPR